MQQVEDMVDLNLEEILLDKVKLEAQEEEDFGKFHLLVVALVMLEDIPL